MILKHFDVIVPEAQPPREGEWDRSWYGFYGYDAMMKCISQRMRTEWGERDRAERAKGQINEGQFEQDCLLSILADIKREHVNMFELGAGWGRICLAVAGAVDHRIIPLTPVTYRCLAVEGEPTHYQWAREHFETHKISGTVVHGVVSNKTGSCRFFVDADPASCYGQAIQPYVSERHIPSIGTLYHIIRKKNTRVPVYTIDSLLQTYGFDHVDIVQMNVQGAEFKAVSGAAGSIKNDLIDYFLIGTHKRELNDSLRRLLSPRFELVVDMYPDTIGTMEGFAPIRNHDGIQLYKRKDL